jgi:hypothetical protein
VILDALIGRLRSGEMTLDEFAQAAAAEFNDQEQPDYPETDGSMAPYTISSVTIADAVRYGDLTEDEAQAIYAALPGPGE